MKYEWSCVKLYLKDRTISILRWFAYWGYLGMIEDGPITCSKYSGRIPTYTIYIHVYTTIYNIDFVQSFLCNWIHVWWWGCFFQISTCRSFLWTSATQGIYKADNHSCLRVHHPLVEPHFGGVDCGYTMSSFLRQEIMKLTPFFGWFEMPRNSWNFNKFLESIRGKCQLAPRFFWRPKGHPSVDSHGADVGGLEMEDVGEMGTS